MDNMTLSKTEGMVLTYIYRKPKVDKPRGLDGLTATAQELVTAKRLPNSRQYRILKGMENKALLYCLPGRSRGDSYRSEMRRKKLRDNFVAFLHSKYPDVKRSAIRKELCQCFPPAEEAGYRAPRYGLLPHGLAVAQWLNDMKGGQP